MKDLSWRHVVVIVAVLSAFTALAIFGKDTSTLITGVVAVLAALGYVGAQVAQVKEKANGNLDLAGLVREQNMHIKELAQLLAASRPPEDAQGHDD